MPFFCSERVIAVAAGSAHSVVLTALGAVWSWEHRRGAHLSKLVTECAVSVSAASNPRGGDSQPHTGILTRRGHLYLSGSWYSDRAMTAGKPPKRLASNVPCAVLSSGSAEVAYR